MSIDGVSHVYPTGKKAVDNLSFKMYQNQIFVLLGGNGAGFSFFYLITFIKVKPQQFRC